MGKKYFIKISKEIAVIRFFKQPASEDIRNAIDEVAEKYPDNSRLWDFSKGTENFTQEELIDFAEYAAQKFTNTGNVALIAPDDLTFGLSRIHGAHREQEQVKINVFRTEQEGLEWLHSNKS